MAMPMARTDVNFSRGALDKRSGKYGHKCFVVGWSRGRVGCAQPLGSTQIGDLHVNVIKLRDR